MKRVLAALLLATLLLVNPTASHAANIKFTAIAPTQGNDTEPLDCNNPNLVDQSLELVIHAQVPGLALEDSVRVMPGQPALFDFGQAPAGNYAVRVWASLFVRPDLVGCDMVAVLPFPARPGKPTLR